MEIENEVRVIRQVASVHWSGKETHYTDQLPTPPKRGWGTCTILGNLFHSSFAIDPSMQREPGARDSTIDAQLNCGALRCRFPSVGVWLGGFVGRLPQSKAHNMLVFA